MSASSSSQEGQYPATRTQLSTQEAFGATRKAFTDLEAMGISDFDIFNALADFFYQRREPEISRLMAEAAYQSFCKE